MSAIIQYALYFAILVALAVPLGRFMARVMDGERTFLTPVLAPVERGIYRLLRIDPSEDMAWKRYLVSVLAFSGIGLVVVIALQMLQGVLPGNPEGLPGVPWDLSFNTAASFITNTNWQAYSGESTLSYLTQFMGLTVQNFVSAGTGIAVMFALIRGFRQVKSTGLGSFWVDLTRIVLYVLIPLNLVLGLALAAGGVVSNFSPAKTAELVEPIAVVQNEDGAWVPFEGAQIDGETVTVDGEVVEGARVVTEQWLPQGPAASQVAIKQTGTNGGGFFGVNSAHPYENPNPFTNLIEMTSLLLIPAACCFTFGIGVKNTRQGKAIFAAMLVLLVVFTGVIGVNEQLGTPQLASDGAVEMAAQDGASAEGADLSNPGGNMEGKETRFGIATSSTWSAFTTAASNGSVNSMHDSYTPLGGMVQMLQMALGEVVFGGVGCGLYGMIGFAILTVFIAGLMVGRTPEFLGKKIEPREMRWAVVLCLATPFCILVCSAIASLIPGISDQLTNGGAHGFSELLYTFTSAGGNNGSAFAGMNANTPLLNVMIGVEMLVARFLPIAGTLAIAGSLASKSKVAETAGTLSTTNGMFVFLLVFVVLLIGALSFFPVLALGPVAEFFQMIA
ncbi:MAG: potassium-transporting ATPase subunit KdpA [Coriobacteriaceae bacterium]|nr:potassium-transporting ATPase subunit KdpA [Coriobacteriaceae bacterium]